MPRSCYSPRNRWGANLTDIESRLKELENRARLDDERWQMMDGKITALSLIFHAIGKPICALNPALLPLIINNLRIYEESARKRNNHEASIAHFRFCRETFEAFAESLEKDATPPDGADDGA
jgi:hypothetical protein